MRIKVFLCAVLVVSINYQLISFSGGNGTQSYPYLISNIDDINELRDSVESLNNIQTTHPPNLINWSRGKYFRLTQDITDAVTTPIGRGFLYI